jgi:hypothetical protein
MSYKWPTKDPDEILDYSIDWSRFLASSTISTVQWYVDDEDGVKTLFSSGTVVNGIQHVSSANTSVVATIHLGLGDNNKAYKFYCRINDSVGNIAERTVRITVKER